MSEQCLSHLTVVEIGHHIPGPLCGRVLADLGANVIKIERPGTGDAARGIGPFFGDDPHPDKSVLFFYLNRNKRGVTLNLSTEAGLRMAKELVAGADVLLENFAPRVLPSLGLDYETLEGINPGLVLTSISNFGQTGPYRDFRAVDIVEYALSGLLYTMGDNDREPLKHGLAQAQVVSGYNAAAATLVAVYARAAIGAGQHVDVSLLESMLGIQTANPLSYAYTGGVVRRRPSMGGMYSGGIMPCEDGYVCPIGSGAQPWETLAIMLDEPELADPKFTNPSTRVAALQELDSVLVRALSRRGKHELFHTAQEWRFPWSLVQDSRDLAECPQLKAREAFLQVEHEETGTVRCLGFPLRMSETPWQWRLPAPTLGEHNEEIYCGRLGYSKQDLIRLREQGVV